MSDRPHFEQTIVDQATDRPLRVPAEVIAPFMGDDRKGVQPKQHFRPL